MNTRLPSNWREPALFLLGLIIGWFVIGWWLWPSGFGGPRPAQLDRVSRQDYLALVADSYAQNGNLAVVQQRLQGFNLDDAARDLDDLARRSDEFGLSAQAARMRNLANVVRRDLLRTAAQPTAAPKTGAAPTGQTPGGLAEQGRDILGGLRQGGLVALVLAVVIVALLAWAAMRWRLARRADQQEEVEVDADEDTGGPGQQGDTDKATRRFVTLNHYDRISYTAGGPDIKQIGILDAEKYVIGSVELRAAEILQRGPDGAPAALELRLFDKYEARTRVTFLVSHPAMKDPTARELINSMSNDYDKQACDVSSPGRVIHLDTLHMHLEATVQTVRFDDATPYPHFQFLELQITPMPASPSRSGGAEKGSADEANQQTVNLSAPRPEGKGDAG